MRYDFSAVVSNKQYIIVIKYVCHINIAKHALIIETGKLSQHLSSKLSLDGNSVSTET